MITGPRRTWSRLVWASRWCRRSIRISTLQGDLVACPIADDFAAREVGIVTRAGDHRPALGSLLEELERTSLKYLSAK